jgi:MFS-type transporter involved in bile tolerance (Atg22 family)
MSANIKSSFNYAVSFLIYNDGIMMLMDNAALIGAILFGFKTQDLIILIIILQITGVAALICLDASLPTRAARKRCFTLSSF